MTTPYRTAAAPIAPRAPWWRRALCAVGLHRVISREGHVAECAHCAWSEYRGPGCPRWH
jgi:hypothetical protein